MLRKGRCAAVSLALLRPFSMLTNTVTASFAADLEADRRRDGAHPFERALRHLRRLFLLGERAIQLRGKPLAEERLGIGCFAHRETHLLW